MNTNHLKRFAKEARLKLLEQVGRKLEFVLTHDTAELRGKQNEVNELKQKIAEQGEKQVIETVAYTWFNRLMALRFMDANGYTLPKVVTPLPGMTNPEILQNALGGNIEPDLRIDRQRLNDLLNGRSAAADAHTEAYKMLLVAACNQWNTAMPFMFERISDYTELLLPDDLLSDYSVIADIRNGMTNVDCQQEEILGWLYQFYISDENERLIGSKKVYAKHELAPASQLFTPKWIVKYMVDNTIGQLWSEINPDTNILSQLEFYIKPAYLEQLQPRHKKALEEITFFDPCVGSGHILAYAFDVFYLMYEEQGYNSSEIPELIIKNNLFGIDIDERAAQIASFVLMMKGRRKNSRFLKKRFTPNITFYKNFESDSKFKNATALGSLITVKPNEIGEIQIEDGSMFAEGQVELKKLYTYLGQRYDCVVTNPPYISSSRMEESLKQYVEANYPDTKSDLFATFIVRCLELCNSDGLTGYMTPFVWMFISSYQKLRENIIDNHFINNLVQLEYSGFDGATVPVCTFTLRNTLIDNGYGSYVRLSDFKGSENQAPKTLEAIKNNNCGWFFTANQIEFEKIPGSPIGYFASNKLIEIFKQSPISAALDTSQGMKTLDNERFIRFWFEVSLSNTSPVINPKSSGDIKWYPINHGGEFRKWYGNNESVLNWAHDGAEIKDLARQKYNSVTRTVTGMGHYFKPGITWTAISSAKLSARIFSDGFIFTNAGMCAFGNNLDCINILGLLNSKVTFKILQILTPTLNFGPDQIKVIPFITPKNDQSALINELIEISRKDWDSSESSWGFKENNLLRDEFKSHYFKDSIRKFHNFNLNRVFEVQKLEEAFNREVILTCDLVDEVSPKVPLAEISLNCNPSYRFKKKAKRKSNVDDIVKETEEVSYSAEELSVFFINDTISEFISFLAGCLFGRYSLDKPGLILANQGETLQDFLQQIPNPNFMPDADNIIPVLDGEWFKDDIVGRFNVFLKAAFGEDYYEENLKYIEVTIGKDIRKYFVKDFYNDHIKRYKKRPIYWMFSSPKGHFKALIYLHRYQPDLCSKLLNDYLQEFISKLEAKRQSQTMFSVRVDISPREKLLAAKEIEKLEAMLKDCREYERTLFTIATKKISIDLDDGVKVNYQMFKEVLVPIKGLEKEGE